MTNLAEIMTQFADPLTVTEVRNRLADAGYEVDLPQIIQLAESGEVKAARSGGAWVFSEFDFDSEKYVRALNDLDAPDTEDAADASFSDRLDAAEAQGRRKGKAESDGGSLDDLRAGRDRNLIGR